MSSDKKDIKLVISNFLGITEMKNCKKVFKQLFSEFVGTFLFLSLTLSSGLAIGDLTPVALSENNATVTIALAHGLMVASIVQIFGHVSGSHINPAVTVGALVCGHIKPLKAVSYILMHVLGSIAGELCADCCGDFVLEILLELYYILCLPFWSIGRKHC